MLICCIYLSYGRSNISSSSSSSSILANILELKSGWDTAKEFATERREDGSPPPPPPDILKLVRGARCSSVVRAMGRRIDPSWGEPTELFLVPASVPRLV